MLLKIMECTPLMSSVFLLRNPDPKLNKSRAQPLSIKLTFGSKHVLICSTSQRETLFVWTSRPALYSCFCIESCIKVCVKVSHELLIRCYQTVAKRCTLHKGGVKVLTPLVLKVHTKWWFVFLIRLSYSLTKDIKNNSTMALVWKRLYNVY